MKAWRLGSTGPRPALRLETAPEPRVNPGEVLVRVHAAGVTPTELGWYPTTHTKSGEHRVGAVPGHEFAGVVAAVGTGAEGLSVGQEIYGMNDWFADGATAEFCVTRPEWVAPKPGRLTFAEAAAVPIGALTAWQGLYDRAKLAAGETVLIHGAAGAVGVFAVQLARRVGATVVATASAANRGFLKGLGVQRVIDYRSERFEDAGPVDVVFDCVGGDTLRLALGALGDGGRMVTVASDAEGTNDERAKRAFFIVEPRGDQLRQIAALLDAGELRAFVRAEVPFEQAAIAYEGAAPAGSTRGKTVVVL